MVLPSKCKYFLKIIFTIFWFYRFKDEHDLAYQVTSINLFKTNIQPTWEDPKNAKGGDFRIEVSNRDPTLL